MKFLDSPEIARATKELQAVAKKHGARVEHCGNGHFQIHGDWMVNYWPLSKKRTAHVHGQASGETHRSPAEAVALAYSKAHPCEPVPQKAKAVQETNAAAEQKEGKGFKRLRAKFRAQGGLCSLCAGPMVLVNFIALKPAARRAAFANPIVATIDHDVPRLHGRAIDNNLRAAHKACNEIKGSELIEPYPLARYENPRPILLKLPDGKFVEMERS